MYKTIVPENQIQNMKQEQESSPYILIPNNNLNKFSMVLLLLYSLTMIIFVVWNTFLSSTITKKTDIFLQKNNYNELNNYNKFVNNYYTKEWVIILITTSYIAISYFIDLYFMKNSNKLTKTYRLALNNEIHKKVAINKI